MSSFAAAQHPCQAISAPDTHYYFLGGLYPDVKMFGDTDKTAVKGSGPEYPRQHRLPSPWLMGQELPGYKEPRKIYCPLPIEFVLPGHLRFSPSRSVLLVLAKLLSALEFIPSN